MSKLKTFIFLFNMVVLLLVGPCFAQADLELLFAQADDKMTNSNPTELQNILQQISNHDLSSNQKQLFLFLKGYTAQVTGEHDEAIKLYRQGLTIGNSIDVKYRTLLMLSNVMSVKQNISASFSYLFQASELVEQVSNPDLKPQAKIQAIASYMTLKLYHETLTISQELLDSNIQGIPRCKALFYKNYSIHELTPEKIQLAELESLIDYCEKHSQPVVALYVKQLIAKHYLFQHEFKKAEDILQSNLDAAEQTKFVHLVGYYYAFLSQAQFSSNQMAKAGKVLDKLLNMQNISVSSEPMVNALKLKAEIEEKLGNTSNALAFYKKYIAADKVYKNTLSIQQAAYHLAKNEILDKNQKIALLEKNNALLTLKNELSTVENNNKKLFIALLIIILAVLSYFAIRAFRNTSIYRKIAENDSLVGISNRYYFTKTVSGLLTGSKTLKRTDAFIIFDLDWFKQVNDQYGHLTGDWVLKTVVEHCKQFVRNVDIFGRIGGEEFALFLPACTAEKAALLAEILRDVIEHIDCNGSGHPIKTTASFGVTCTDRSGYELRQLFRDADIALYLSKNQGRNKVTLFEVSQHKPG